MQYRKKNPQSNQIFVKWKINRVLKQGPKIKQRNNQKEKNAWYGSLTWMIVVIQSSSTTTSKTNWVTS